MEAWASPPISLWTGAYSWLELQVFLHDHFELLSNYQHCIEEVMKLDLPERASFFGVFGLRGVVGGGG